MNNVVLIILISLCVLLFVVLLFFVYLYFVLFRPNVLRLRKPMRKLDASHYYDAFMVKINEGKKWFLSMNIEDVSIVSYDGLKLTGYFLPVDDAKGSILLVHGFHSSGPTDFSVVVKFYHEMGYNLLVINQRTHNSSEGKYITFGVKERFDVRDWVLFLNEKQKTNLPIVIGGVSMGATCVMLATNLELPSNVKAIVVDCGFTNAYDLLKSILATHMHVAEFPFVICANVLTRVIAGFSLKQCSTTTALEKNNIPIMIIHGEDDELVPVSMSEDNFKACKGEKYFYVTKKAGHAMSYLMEPEKYNRLLTEFITNCCV